MPRMSVVYTIPLPRRCEPAEWYSTATADRDFLSHLEDSAAHDRSEVQDAEDQFVYDPYPGYSVSYYESVALGFAHVNSSLTRVRDWQFAQRLQVICKGQWWEQCLGQGMGGCFTPSHTQSPAFFVLMRSIQRHRNRRHFSSNALSKTLLPPSLHQSTAIRKNPEECMFFVKISAGVHRICGNDAAWMVHTRCVALTLPGCCTGCVALDAAHGLPHHGACMLRTVCGNDGSWTSMMPGCCAWCVAMMIPGRHTVRAMMLPRPRFSSSNLLFLWASQSRGHF